MQGWLQGSKKSTEDCAWEEGLLYRKKPYNVSFLLVAASDHVSKDMKVRKVIPRQFAVFEIAYAARKSPNLCFASLTWRPNLASLLVPLVHSGFSPLPCHWSNKISTDVARVFNCLQPSLTWLSTWIHHNLSTWVSITILPLIGIGISCNNLVHTLTHSCCDIQSTSFILPWFPSILYLTNH